MAEDLFAIGQRVRIRLSGECGQVQHPIGVNAAWDGPPSIGHPPWQEGKRGRVRAVAAPTLRVLPGHTIGVQYDEPHEEPIRGAIGVHVGGYFAPHELVPLDADGNEVLHPALATFER